VDASLEIFGKRLSSPFLISCMTGALGSSKIQPFARAGRGGTGIAIGVGSGRALLEHPELLDSFDGAVAPNALLFANLRRVSSIRLWGLGMPQPGRRAAGRCLVLHLNPLQEALSRRETPYFGASRTDRRSLP